MNYVIVSRDGLFDFRKVILSDVYEQLWAFEDFESAGLVVVGAMDEDRPVGAAVLAILEYPYVKVLSLYVSAAKRSQGIGSTLIQAMLQVAFEYTAETRDVPTVIMDMEYMIFQEDIDRFRKFLIKNGFQQDAFLDDIYTATAGTVISKLENTEAELHLLSELSEDGVTELSAELVANRIDGESMYSCVSGTLDEPRCMVITEYNNDHVYNIYSANLMEEVSENEYQGALKFALEALIASDPEAQIIAVETKNLYPDLWKSFAESTAIHGDALLTAVFDREA